MQELLLPGAAGGPIGIGVAIVVTAIQILGSIFLGGGDTSAIWHALDTLRNETALALDALKRFTWSVGRLALAGMLAIWRILNDILKGILDLLRSLINALADFYRNCIKPILVAIQNLRKILDEVYAKYLRPIINAIQKVRRILAILRAFGFKWAGALDQRLARIESRIIYPYIWLIRQLNGYGQWINVILTAGGWIQKPLFLNTVYANLGAITNLWWVGQSGALSGGIATSPTNPVPPATLAAIRADFQLYVQTGGGQAGATAQQARAYYEFIQAGG